MKLTYFDKILLDVLDIDECAIKTDKCDDNAVCNNTQGCYLCTCKDGFYGSGKSCIGNYKRARHVMPSWSVIPTHIQQARVDCFTKTP